VLVFEAIANTKGRTEPVEGDLYGHLEPLVSSHARMATSAFWFSSTDGITIFGPLQGNRLCSVGEPRIGPRKSAAVARNTAQS